MRTISPYELTDNAFHLIDKEWMLVAAGTPERHNAMTASWGGVGILWNKPVAFIFIRLQRHTLGFVEEHSSFTLSFFAETYRPALTLCGTVSGRDCDKIAQSGLSPMPFGKSVAFAEARMVMECTKLYAQNLERGCFIDTQVMQTAYPQADYHRMFIGEIVQVALR